jgi:hypothetical protein
MKSNSVQVFFGTPGISFSFPIAASLIFIGRNFQGISTEEITVDDDEDSYFSSYSHYSIHEEMLKVAIVLKVYRIKLGGNKWRCEL